jgi:hypothetical protein
MFEQRVFAMLVLEVYHKKQKLHSEEQTNTCSF